MSSTCPVTLPARFVTAAETMAEAFVAGTDQEADRAATVLEDELLALDPAAVAHAEELTDLAAAALGRAAAARIRAQLPRADWVGTRPLPGGLEVRVLRLPDATEVAVVVPTGSGPAVVAAREALLTGQCRPCGALLEATMQVSHAGTCPASRPETGPAA